MKGSRMRRLLTALVGAVPLALALSLVATPAQAGPLVQVDAATPHVSAGQYVLPPRSRPPASVASARGIAAQHVYTGAVNGFAATLSDAQLSSLQRDPRVA